MTGRTSEDKEKEKKERKKHTVGMVLWAIVSGHGEEMSGGDGQWPSTAGPQTAAIKKK